MQETWDTLTWSIQAWTTNITDNAIIWYALKIGTWILIFILLTIISKIIANIIKKNIRKHMEESNPAWAKKIAKLLWNITFYILILFAIFISFEIIGINIWLLISGVSLWVWLAFKEVLWNMFAGMMILYTKEFKMWDIIEIQWWENYFWRVEEITIRYTVIRTLDLRQVIIPNMTMISEPIKTFSSEDIVKLNTTIWISYENDVNKAIETAINAINSFDFVKSKENTVVFVSDFWKSSIDLKCLFCFDPKCWIIWEIAVWEIHQKIWEEFKENGIKFTHHHITLNFEPWEDEKRKIINMLDNKEQNENKEQII